MSLLTIELQKEKRTGVIPVLIVVGILGAAYSHQCCQGQSPHCLCFSHFLLPHF